MQIDGRMTQNGPKLSAPGRVLSHDYFALFVFELVTGAKMINVASRIFYLQTLNFL